ncbi:hypothetical protein A2U01_0033687, partial [Trifolium medium]|nr:hypothetical protein [Trifolium medium]
MAAVGVRCGTSRCHGASDVFIISCWPVAALLFSDLVLHFVSFINSLSGFTLVFVVPLSLLGLSALSLSKSALSVFAGRCASALLESALPILALIFSLWDVLGSYPAKGAP